MTKRMEVTPGSMKVIAGIDFGSTKAAVTYLVEGQEGEPEVLTYPPIVVGPNNRKPPQELIATVSVNLNEAEPQYIVGEPSGVSNTEVFTSLKLLLDESSGAKAHNERVNQRLDHLNSGRRSANLSEVTRDNLLQALFRRIFKRIREVIRERYPSCDNFTIHFRIGHPVHWRIKSKHKLRELATEAGHKEEISLTVSLINEARAAFAKIVDWNLVKVTSHQKAILLTLSTRFRQKQ